MIDHMADTESILRRLDRLERQNQRLRRAMILCFVLPPSLVLTTGAARFHRSRTVQAGEFVLKDVDGKTRAVLGMKTAGPGLTLFDDAEKERATFSILTAGPVVGLYDTNGNARVLLGATPKGAILTFNDAEEKLRAQLGMSAGNSSLLFYDADGKVVYHAP